VLWTNTGPLDSLKSACGVRSFMHVLSTHLSRYPSLLLMHSLQISQLFFIRLFYWLKKLGQDLLGWSAFIFRSPSLIFFLVLCGISSWRSNAQDLFIVSHHIGSKIHNPNSDSTCNDSNCARSSTSGLLDGGYLTLLNASRTHQTNAGGNSAAYRAYQLVVSAHTRTHALR